MTIDRRTLLAAGGLAALAAPALAQTVPPPGPLPPSPPPRPAAPPAPPPSLVIPLWPATPPGGEGRAARATPGGNLSRNIDVPSLALYRPADPDGSALIIFPGGGYVNLSLTNEGSSPALRFNADRVTTFILSYRLPAEGWANPQNVPLQDAQRAIRLVRARAAEFKIDPRRVGIVGYSAGGHLAASLATRHGEQTYAPIDAVDTQSAKPSFVGLIYPVITMTEPFTHRGSTTALLGATPTDAARAARSNELLVTADTAPCFLVHGMPDAVVPVDNSILMLQALRAAKVPCEAHLYQEGGHGFGLGTPGRSNAEWPAMFTAWIRRVAPVGAA